MPNKRINRTRLPFSAIAMVFLAFAFLCFHGSVRIAQGLGDSATANIAGYAWSSTFGWISMNCSNTNTCGTSNYGVNINTSLDPAVKWNLDGHAWSPNAGWISFEYDGLVPPDKGNFTSKCYNDGFGIKCLSSSCTACYNPSNGKIFGWARMVNLGNSGWISLGATSTSPGITIDRTIASGTFSGWAWGSSHDGDNGLGWISFNCNNSGIGNTCAQSNYSVWIKNHTLPAASALNAPNWSYSNACTSSLALQAFLGWQNNSSNVSAYRVIVSPTNNINDGSAYDTGTTTAVNPTQFLLNKSKYAIMNYNLPYYWWVRIIDDFGFISTFRKFDYGLVASDTLTTNAVGNGTTFITYKHEMPKVLFSYAPPLPLYNNPVTTTDASLSYVGGVGHSCWTAPRCTWLWSGNANMLTNSAPTASSTVMTFKYSKLSNPAKIFLTVTDSDGYSCSTSTPNFIVDLLPVWKETQAQ